MKLDEYNFLEYLKKYHPYLYDFEMEIRKVNEATGFGDVSVSCIIKRKIVCSTDVNSWVKNIYEKREQGFIKK